MTILPCYSRPVKVSSSLGLKAIFKWRCSGLESPHGTINNTRDFYIGKNLRNLPVLRRIGFQANRCLLQVEQISQDCILAEEVFQKVNHPIQVDTQRGKTGRVKTGLILIKFSTSRPLEGP